AGAELEEHRGGLRSAPPCGRDRCRETFDCCGITGQTSSAYCQSGSLGKRHLSWRRETDSGEPEQPIFSSAPRSNGGWLRASPESWRPNRGGRAAVLTCDKFFPGRGGPFQRSSMHIHILGICGTFMGSLAVLAKELGHRVTGSDANVYPPMSTQLEAQGIELMQGY